ncbi:YciI family protein [Neisseria perflava]|uniref:YciI family protein n=1 Tax=Neisseria perflava TaxID=33053 RepID=UPI00209FE207|nr:YciI family protein [Neisseria perflava]MCP1661249.1 uncharacterized protein YciI [Neisseria perflava]MCP1772259.1 uncharacterized protein YciI [Neisseria perflava]
MYLINITVNDDVTEAQQAEMFPKHAAWFKKHFEAGNFLLLGSFIDTEKHNGMIIAHADSREALEAILNEDCYYPNFARYEIREFAPKMAGDLSKFIG